jgi:hypothetical protein
MIASRAEKNKKLANSRQAKKPVRNLFMRDATSWLRERLWSSGYDMGFPSP